MSQPTRQHLRVETVTGTTVVTFVESSLLSEEVIQEVGDQLASLVEDQGNTRLLLNFSNVKFMSSAILGQLIKLNKKVTRANGRLKLCGFAPNLREVFRISQLDRLFEIYDDEQLALDRF